MHISPRCPAFLSLTSTDTLGPFVHIQTIILRVSKGRQGHRGKVEPT